ncbi:MAG: DUF4388 domain-containing protein [Actinobacteria bacterium]|nr:DUF4388 domain-containing protein [Actinomycetota bacterium]
MSLKGNIKDFQLDEIVRFIEAGKKTGALEIQNGPEAAVLYFKKGSLYFVHRGSKPISITEKVLNSGIIEEDIAQKIKSGKIFPPETANLSEEARKKVAQMIFDELVEQTADIFSWSEGTFVFKNNEKRTGEDWGVTIDTTRFLEKVRKHSEVFKRFSEHAKTLKTVIELNKNISPDEDIIITGKEWKFLSAWKPGMTIEEVAKNSGISLLTAITLATNLMEKGLIVAKNEELKEEARESLPSEQETEKIVQQIRKESVEEKEELIETPSEIEETLDEESLIDELAAITGTLETTIESSENTKKELESILKTLKEL